jgi:HD-GYP domain-containing protein (c-di-GMP phosphodiesterase class II)
MNHHRASQAAGGPAIEAGGRADLGRRPPAAADFEAVHEACDAATVGHMERTGEIAAVLAARADFPARRVERLRRAARLHDIGKAMSARRSSTSRAHSTRTSSPRCDGTQ